jgi:putative tricarboxylic transport membrane protein
LVPAVIGLFAIPELVDLTVRGTSISGDVPLDKLGKGVWQGIKDTYVHWWLVIRCSLIGSGLGILPGIGGGVSQWVSYAHAVQSAKTPEEREMFGKGYVKGVLGPGSANNSKEGAALVTTVGFGIPTTGSMAVLLGGFYILGLQPSPEMLTKHLTITYSMVWTIIVANIIVVLASLLLVNKLAALTNIKGHFMVPFILLLCFIGAYSTNENLLDLLVVLVMGGGWVSHGEVWLSPPPSRPRVGFGEPGGDVFLYVCQKISRGLAAPPLGRRIFAPGRAGGVLPSSRPSVFRSPISSLSGE